MPPGSSLFRNCNSSRVIGSRILNVSLTLGLNAILLIISSALIPGNKSVSKC